MAEQRVVRKNKAGVQDLVLGKGKVTQTRGNNEYQIDKLDMHVAVNSVAEMTALDVEDFTRARVYSSATEFVDYIYDENATEGEIPDAAPGRWVGLATKQSAFTSISEAKSAANSSPTSIVEGSTIILSNISRDWPNRRGNIYQVVTLASERIIRQDNSWEPDERDTFELTDTLVAVPSLTRKMANHQTNRTLSQLNNFNDSWQFGGTREHYLSKNAVVIFGDSVTQGANAGYYMDNGFGYKLKRALMEVYQTKSYGYLSVDNKDGFITAPQGAYRWYEPSTDGTLRQNEDALNAIGGTEVELQAAQFVRFQFNRADKYSKEIIPNQRKYRIVFNDSTGSVRVTANGIGYSINDVVTTNGTGISDVLDLPASWDGDITITRESGVPILNGIVLMATEDDYCIHHIYNGGRSHIEVSDDVYSKVITNADLYIHALGINDTFGATSPTQLDAAIDQIISVSDASIDTKILVLDLIWMQPSYHFAREGLKRLVDQVKAESKLINIPALIANNGIEYTAVELASDEIKFLASDQVHPFLNGHSFITNAVLSELGLSQSTQKIKSVEEREELLKGLKATSYCFEDTDLSRLIVGWTSDGSNSLSYTEGAGTVALGFIYPAYIETLQPVNKDFKYVLTVDIENIDSTGTHSFGSRSYDALGNEIFEQDSAGDLAGNLPLTFSLSPGERSLQSVVLSNRNNSVGTDKTAFEPGAAFWNIALVLNNGDPVGSVKIHSISVHALPETGIGYTVSTFNNTWASAGGLQIKKDIDGTIRFIGSIEGPGEANNSSIFVLAQEYRPTAQLDFPMYDDNTELARLRIETSGFVRISGNANPGWSDSIPLDFVSYNKGD